MKNVHGHIRHVVCLYRTYITTFPTSPEEPVQRPAGFLLNLWVFELLALTRLQTDSSTHTQQALIHIWFSVFQRQ